MTISISDAITEMNRERERDAVTRTRTIINSIVAQQEIIRKAKLEITRLQTDLQAVSFETVMAADAACREAIESMLTASPAPDEPGYEEKVESILQRISDALRDHAARLRALEAIAALAASGKGAG